MSENYLDEICGTCGFTYGGHRADSICRNQCPQTEGRMDWDMNHITVFRPTGEYKEQK